MRGQQVENQDVLPDARPEMTISNPGNTCPAPVSAFVGKAFVKQVDGTVTVDLVGAFQEEPSC